MFPTHNFANQLGVSADAMSFDSVKQEPSHSAFGDPTSVAQSSGGWVDTQGREENTGFGMGGMPGVGAIPMGQSGAPGFSQDHAKSQLQSMIQMIQSGDGHGHSHGGEGPGENMMISMQQRLSRLNPEQMEKFQARMMEVMKQNHAMMAAQGISPEEMHAPLQGGAAQGGHGHSHGGHEGMDGGHGHSHGGHGHSHGDGPCGEDHGQSEIPTDVVSPTITKGYMYHDPLGAKLPMDALFNISGGGHYQPPEFGWGALAPKTDEGKPSIVPSPLEGHRLEPNTLFVNIEGEKDSSPRNRIIVKNLPILGRVRFIIEKQGIIQWGFILLYWIYGNFSTWNCILLPQRADGHMPIVLIYWYALVSVLCLASFLRASTINPGRATAEDEKYANADWTFCTKCNHRRPPKAHHCRRCNQCVLKMDHHCPWINNCVGEENQYAFMQLVFYAYLLSLTSLVLSVLYWWHMKPCVACDQTSFVIVHQKALVVVLTILSVLMTMGGGGLVLTQHINVAMNTTTIEWMKIQQEMARTGQWPSWSSMPKQDKGMFASYRQLCGQGSFLFWLCPFGRRRSIPKAAAHTV